MPDADDSGMNTYLARTCASAGFDQRIAHLTGESHVGTPLYRELVLAWRVDSPVAPLVPELCAMIADRYLTLVDKAPFYLSWWHEGGAGFALP